MRLTSRPAAVVLAASTLMGVGSLGVIGGRAESADGATWPQARTSASVGTLVCTDRRFRITLVSGDGTHRRTLGVVGENPSFSPDGRRIAFRRYQRGLPSTIAPRLFVSDRAGRNVHTVVSLSRSAYYGTPPQFNPLAWSRDSTRVAYVREFLGKPGEESVERLFTADVTGGEHAVQLHRAEVEPSAEHLRLWMISAFTTFSPDGTTLAVAGYSFADAASGQFTRGIWSVDAGTGAARLLAALPVSRPLPKVYGLSWSPDGKRLAVYDGAKTGASGLRGFFVLDLASGKATPGDPLVGDRWIRWSPDGRRIALAGVADTGRNTRYDSRVADAVTGRVIDPSRRTPAGFEETHQLWSPDGKRIAFNRIYKGQGVRTRAAYERAQARSGVFVVPATGGTPKQIIRSSPVRPGANHDLTHTNELECTDWSPR